MLKKIHLEKELLISFIFFITSLALFSIGIFGFLQHHFDWVLLSRYALVSLVISLYLFIVMHKNFDFAFLLFLIGYVFAYGIYLYNATKDYSGFLEIAGIISWFVIMVMVIALGLTVELLLIARRKNKELKKIAKEKEVLEEKIHEQLEADFKTPEIRIENEEENNQLN